MRLNLVNRRSESEGQELRREAERQRHRPNEGERSDWTTALKADVEGLTQSLRDWMERLDKSE
jgi:hypothetical protein